jgi:hypothetical protein
VPSAITRFPRRLEPGDRRPWRSEALRGHAATHSCRSWGNQSRSAWMKPLDKERLFEVHQRLLYEADEKKVREVIASLGLEPESPRFQNLLRIWRELREKEGWRVS